MGQSQSMRHKFAALPGIMRIVQIGGRTVQSKAALVDFVDVGLTGLCFSTELRLPLDKEIWLEFELRIASKTILAYGLPVWSREAGGRYEYGVNLAGNDKKIFDTGFRLWREALVWNRGRNRAERYKMFEAEGNARSSLFKAQC